jgi:hypothetical protein
MRRMLSAIAAAALVGCAGTGSGWSRAPDLSVYGSAHAYARVAWEQDVYCEGATPAAASASFAREFGGRDAAVRAALVERHGEEALARARRHFVSRVPCGDVPDAQWRDRYGRLLRVLEIRLGLAPGREG